MACNLQEQPAINRNEQLPANFIEACVFLFCNCVQTTVCFAVEINITIPPLDALCNSFRHTSCATDRLLCYKSKV